VAIKNAAKEAERQIMKYKGKLEDSQKRGAGEE
jgi:ribosome-associated translation inhibitor RaiA